MSHAKIDPKGTTINLHKWVSDHNDTVPFAERAKRIRGGLYNTAKCILKDFIKAHAQEKTKEGYYETSSSLVAQYTQQSRHTIIRHIKKLQQLGFIEGVKRDGSFGNNYRIKIRQQLIEWIEDVVAKIKESGNEITEQISTHLASELLSSVVNPNDIAWKIAKRFESPTKRDTG